MKHVVLFHAACPDGFAAAYVVWSYERSDGMEFIPVTYFRPAPDVSGADLVTIVDFSYDTETLTKMADQIPDGKILVIDHHETAQNGLAALSHPRITKIFDMGHSGAVLTEAFFQSMGSRITNVPWWLPYVEDRDLWRWKLDSSREVNAWFATCFPLIPYDEGKPLENADEIFRAFANKIVPFEEAAEIGRPLWEIVKKGYESQMSSMRRLRFLEWDNVPVTNMTAVHSSEALNALAAEASCKFAVGWSMSRRGTCKYSLRSINPGGPNVADIAARFGGGGHPHAAGFETPKPIHDLGWKGDE